MIIGVWDDYAFYTLVCMQVLYYNYNYNIDTRHRENFKIDPCNLTILAEDEHPLLFQNVIIIAL